MDLNQDVFSRWALVIHVASSTHPSMQLSRISDLFRHQSPSSRSNAYTNNHAGQRQAFYVGSSVSSCTSLYPTTRITPKKLC
eukprot:scaffold243200_cov66-Cyclotella_meneghiniana.AAC.6